MITRSSIKDVLEHLPEEEISKVLQDDLHYITLEANSYGCVTIGSCEYDAEEEGVVTSNGDIYTDKCNFVILLQEVLGTEKTDQILDI